MRSMFCRRVVEGILEALEEMKPTSIVGVKLQEVELGSSAPQILGVKVQLTALAKVNGVDRGVSEVDCVDRRVNARLTVLTGGLSKSDCDCVDGGVKVNLTVLGGLR